MPPPIMATSSERKLGCISGMSSTLWIMMLLWVVRTRLYWPSEFPSRITGEWLSDTSLESLE